MREGTEVLTQGAELEGGEEGCHPMHQEGEVGGEAGPDLAPRGQPRESGNRGAARPAAEGEGVPRIWSKMVFRVLPLIGMTTFEI